MAKKQEQEVERVEGAPSPEKIAAWEQVLKVWKAMGKSPRVTQELLDAEYEAANTD